MIELFTQMLVVAALCLLLGLVYPAVYIIGHRLLGGKKPLRQLFREL